jgi:glycosyltransferase involved in cell wall biosynthesis
MGVHNGMPWIREAVASVLGQTAPDLELIVVDDESTDATPGALAAVTDPRLRVIRQSRQGLTRALNRGFALSVAPLIARLDADDIALPERLARQRAVLDARSEVGVLGTGAREVDEAGRQIRLVIPPADHEALRHALIRANPIVHSSVMMRRAVLEALGGYDERLSVAQDYDLWMRMAAVTRLGNIPEPLVVRRLLSRRVSVTRDADRLRAECGIRWRAVRRGAYPWWCAAFAVRPVLALALPATLRAGLRQARRG